MESVLSVQYFPAPSHRLDTSKCQITIFSHSWKKNQLETVSPAPEGRSGPQITLSQQHAGRWHRVCEEVTAALWHLEEGLSLFWVLLGAFPSQVVQPGPGGNPNLTSINQNEKRSVEGKPQARLAAPRVCADPPGLGLPWLPACGVGESSALGCPHPLQDPDGSLPAQQTVWFCNTEPSCASLHLPEPRLSSTGPRCFLVAGIGTRSFSLFFPIKNCKEVFPTGWRCKGRPKGRDHKQTHKDWAGKHCNPQCSLKAPGVCVRLLELWQENF